ncbi:hypothetical protein CapIbe_007293, partial [Capra ibex]
GQKQCSEPSQREGRAAESPGPPEAELSQLYIAKVTGDTCSEFSNICAVHEFTALILTVINQTQEENLRKFHKPQDLLPKKVHALNPRLNEHRKFKDHGEAAATEDAPQWRHTGKLGAPA